VPVGIEQNAARSSTLRDGPRVAVIAAKRETRALRPSCHRRLPSRTATRT